MATLKSVLHHFNKALKEYDTLHPETEVAQIVDLLPTINAAINGSSVTWDGKKFTNNALGITGLIDTNGYVAFGPNFGGLIIQWTTLKQELTEQTIELNQLRQKLKMLRSTSREQIKLLESLQNDLSKTQENLMSSNVSLTACRNELKESRASLQTLKNQIKNLKHKQEVTRRQRDTWAALCGLVLVASVR